MRIDQASPRAIVPVEQKKETVACGFHFGLALFPSSRGVSRDRGIRSAIPAAGPVSFDRAVLITVAGFSPCRRIFIVRCSPERGTGCELQHLLVVRMGNIHDAKWISSPLALVHGADAVCCILALHLQSPIRSVGRCILSQCGLRKPRRAWRSASCCRIRENPGRRGGESTAFTHAKIAAEAREAAVRSGTRRRVEDETAQYASAPSLRALMHEQALADIHLRRADRVLLNDLALVEKNDQRFLVAFGAAVDRVHVG